ncbi:MAG: G1 family glutamic endopeptidase [Acidimicrobiales bacterium]
MARGTFVRGMIATAAVTAMLAMPASAVGGTVPRHLSQSVMERISALDSTNWAGYVATSGPYTSVSASWTEPTVKCSSSEEEELAAFWVGLDGGETGDDTVEQTGTLAICVFGTVIGYVAWYEMYPNPLSEYTKTVDAGDHMSASVNVSGSSYTLTISDTTRHWTETTVQSATASDATAEVIAEAPATESGGTITILPLADFGKVKFSNAMVDGATLASASPEQVTMADTNGTVKAVASAIKTNGEKFNVTWKHV